ncbi:MAG: outer membrane beta-barrel protein [Saprospiraceae bacterium]
MKKILFYAIVAFFMLSSTKQNAQSFTTGISLGVSTGTVKVSELNSAITNTINGKNIYGFEGGIFSRLNLDPLFIKGMALVAYRGGLSDYISDDGTIIRSKLNVGKIEIPLLLGLRILGPLRIEAGPVFNYIFNETHSADNSFNLKKSGLGYRAGVNLEFGFLNIGLAYQGIKNKGSITSSSSYETPDELIFTLGIGFGGKQ